MASMVGEMPALQEGLPGLHSRRGGYRQKGQDSSAALSGNWTNMTPRASGDHAGEQHADRGDLQQVPPGRVRQERAAGPGQDHDRRGARPEGEHREQAVQDTRRAAGQRQEPVDQAAGEKTGQDPREQDARPARSRQERPDERSGQAGRASAADPREGAAGARSPGPAGPERRAARRPRSTARPGRSRACRPCGRARTRVSRRDSEEGVGEHPAQRVEELALEVRAQARAPMPIEIAKPPHMPTQCAEPRSPPRKTSGSCSSIIGGSLQRNGSVETRGTGTRPSGLPACIAARCVPRSSDGRGERCPSAAGAGASWRSPFRCWRP